MLLAKAANIQRIRKIAAAQAAARRDASKAKVAVSAAVKAAVHEDSVLVLHDKLEAKRASSAVERARIASETKKIRFEQMQQAAGASEVEANKFQELRAGAMREAQARQASRLHDASLYEATKATAYKVRMSNVKATLRTKERFLSAYEARLAEATAQCEAERQADQQRKKALASQCREDERTMRESRAMSSYMPSSPSERLAA